METMKSIPSHPAVTNLIRHPQVQTVSNFVVGHKYLGIFSFLLLGYFAYGIGLCVYRYWFHPLSKFPGPPLAAVSDLWFSYVNISGKSIHYVRDAHLKYGPVVRLAPNQLSFGTSSSLRDIYGKTTGRKTFPKTEYYTDIAFGFENAGVATELDPAVHKVKRNFLAPVFSTQALADFEGLVQGHFDKFLHAMDRLGTTAEGMNIADWLGYLTFDITGDLTFGESFGALENEKNHKWMSLINDNLDLAAYAESMRRFPFINSIATKFVPQRLLDARTYHVEWTKKKTHKRIYSPEDPDRKDMMTYLLNSSGAKGVTHDEITSHAAQIIIGGSETVATFSTFTIYHLLTNPETNIKLKEEIRSRFNDVSEITPSSTVNLPYLNAVIEESLRISPPGPTGLPRYSPGETVDGHYIPKGVRLSSHPWTISHNEAYWKDHNAFRPDRWLDPDNTDHREASLPFGIGPRNCIGINLAWIEMRLFMTKMIYLFDLEMKDPTIDWVNECQVYMLWQKAPFYVYARRRPGAEDQAW
ncbi:cytochrome P450 [Geopyxis carbonaria]|nr:cytochrome P450 [Geopyxis carbonaria]